MKLNELLSNFGSNVRQELVRQLDVKDAVDWDAADYRLVYDEGEYFIYKGLDLIVNWTSR